MVSTIRDMRVWGGLSFCKAASLTSAPVGLHSGHLVNNGPFRCALFVLPGKAVLNGKLFIRYKVEYKICRIPHSKKTSTTTQHARPLHSTRIPLLPPTGPRKSHPPHSPHRTPFANLRPRPATAHHATPTPPPRIPPPDSLASSAPASTHPTLNQLPRSPPPEQANLHRGPPAPVLPRPRRRDAVHPVRAMPHSTLGAGSEAMGALCPTTRVRTPGAKEGGEGLHAGFEEV